MACPTACEVVCGPARGGVEQSEVLLVPAQPLVDGVDARGTQ